MVIPAADLTANEAMLLWSREKSEYAKEQAILSNSGIVFMVLKDLGVSLFDDDMVCNGFVGMIKALNSFDEAKGYEFSTYAFMCVRNEILMTFRKKQVPVSFSLDEKFQVGNHDECCYGDIIADEHRFEDAAEAKEAVATALNCLTEKERKLICLLYGIGCRQMTQCEAAGALGHSQSYVCRLEKKALKKMKEGLFKCS